MTQLVPNSWGSAPLREANDCHSPAGTPVGGQFCSKGGVPPKPGSTPIPPGMIRGYHYTKDEFMPSVLKHGLSTDYAKGSSYGEPNAIWMSGQQPADYKSYVEVFVTPEEAGQSSPGRPLWVKGPDGSYKPAETAAERQQVIDEFNQRGANFTLMVKRLPPSRFVTHSVPWMARYYHLMEDADTVADILRGTHDALAVASPDDYGPAIRAIKAKFAGQTPDPERSMAKRRERRRAAMLTEANDCHSPAGTPVGGQFCSKAGGTTKSAGEAPWYGKMKKEVDEAIAQAEVADQQVRKRLGRRRGGPDYRIVFRSQVGKAGGPGFGFFLPGGTYSRFRDDGSKLTDTQEYKARVARVALQFESHASAHLGAPTIWKAPNGVEVYYRKGQRRTAGGFATYHDFNVGSDELVIPLTRNVGSGRRALRAWAAKFTAPKVLLRFQARRMVRSGD